MPKWRALSLTPELVALCEREVADPGPAPGLVQLSLEEITAKAAEIDAECGASPLWLFAYGSLIWKPEVEAARRGAQRRAAGTAPSAWNCRAGAARRNSRAR